jgi:hypothetical protein
MCSWPWNCYHKLHTFKIKTDCEFWLDCCFKLKTFFFFGLWSSTVVEIVQSSSDIHQLNSCWKPTLFCQSIIRSSKKYSYWKISKLHKSETNNNNNKKQTSFKIPKVTKSVFRNSMVKIDWFISNLVYIFSIGIQAKSERFSMICCVLIS